MRLGIQAATAAEQLQRPQAGGEGFQALPPRPEGELVATADALQLPAAGESVTFHVIGDSGGVKDPVPQQAVAAAMVSDLVAHPEVAFCWHVGDIVYFEGARGEAVPQFFEPYARYNRHILGIPGNHDGEGGDQLATFMRYFCQPSPTLWPEVAEFQRDAVQQPYCFWTLAHPCVTIIGLYSNVPSGGEIDTSQQSWLAAQVKAASAGVPLVVSVHHPPYSIDLHHGGSQHVGEVLDGAFTAAGRAADVVLSGHVHDYQHFQRSAFGKSIDYVVCGAGGYHNLHELAPVQKGQELAPGVTVEGGNDVEWGFLRLTVSAQQISGAYIGVARDGSATQRDSFSRQLG